MAKQIKTTTDKSGIALTNEEKSTAIKTLTAFVKADSKADTTLSTCLWSFVALAREHVGKGGKYKAEADVFKALCKEAETAYKLKHSVENMKDVSASWSVFKSNALRAYGQNISGWDVGSFAEFRAAAKAKSQASKAQTDGAASGQPAMAGEKDKPVIADAPAPVPAISNAELAVQLKALNESLPDLSATDQERLAKLLADALAELHAFRQARITRNENRRRTDKASKKNALPEQVAVNA